MPGQHRSVVVSHPGTGVAEAAGQVRTLSLALSFEMGQ